MARLYLSTESDSFYLDLTAGDGEPTTMVVAADGVHLHLDVARTVVAVEVLELSRRAGEGASEAGLGDLHVNTSTDSVYYDVSAGTRPPATMTPIADDVYAHVDEHGELVAIEVIGLARRGGLQIDDLDAAPGSTRPAIFDEIEKAIAGQP
jgi:uncharacterized protein YuzE